MIDLLNTIILIATGLVVLAVIFFAFGSKHQFRATLAQKQAHEDGSVMLIFTYPSKNKLQLKVGQQILIKTHLNQKGKQFTPIHNAVGSFKILIIPSMSSNSDSQQDHIIKELQALEPKSSVYAQIAENNLQYMGKSQIKIRTASNREYVKKFKSIYILAQGNKTPIVYQIVKGICEEKTEQKPNITVLFVGGGIADFALKNQFEQLQDNYDNIKYFYSLPVKGERQPSIVGLGISSQKVSESFDSDSSQTFCILCAEQNDLCVAVERSLLNKKVSSSQIYKY